MPWKTPILNLSCHWAWMCGRHQVEGAWVAFLDSFRPWIEERLKSMIADAVLLPYPPTPGTTMLEVVQ